MAFNVQNLNLISYSTNSSAPAMYAYFSDDDPLSIIIGSGYFGIIASEFTTNDIIYITDSSGLQSSKGFYNVVSVDIDGKKVYLAPLINQSGAVSKWVEIPVAPIPAPVITKKAQPNTGYRIVPTVIDDNVVFPDVDITLPDPDKLTVGDTLMFNNTSPATVNVKQVAGQLIYFPDGQKTTVGKTGSIISDKAGDSFTLVVAYNNPNILDGDNYGTIFNILNSTGVVSYT